MYILPWIASQLETFLGFLAGLSLSLDFLSFFDFFGLEGESTFLAPILRLEESLLGLE